MRDVTGNDNQGSENGRTVALKISGDIFQGKPYSAIFPGTRTSWNSGQWYSEKSYIIGWENHVIARNVAARSHDKTCSLQRW